MKDQIEMVRVIVRDFLTSARPGSLTISVINDGESVLSITFTNTTQSEQEGE
jgi:hypothetical protein